MCSRVRRWNKPWFRWGLLARESALAPIPRGRSRSGEDGGDEEAPGSIASAGARRTPRRLARADSASRTIAASPETSRPNRCPPSRNDSFRCAALSLDCGASESSPRSDASEVCSPRGSFGSTSASRRTRRAPLSPALAATTSILAGCSNLAPLLVAFAPGTAPPRLRCTQTTTAVDPPWTSAAPAAGRQRLRRGDRFDRANERSTARNAATHAVSRGDPGASAPASRRAPSIFCSQCEDAEALTWPSNTAKHPRRSPLKEASSKTSGAAVETFASARRARRADVRACMSGSARNLSSDLREAICEDARGGGRGGRRRTVSARRERERRPPRGGGGRTTEKRRIANDERGDDT